MTTEYFGQPLSSTERLVRDLVVEGLTNREIAARMTLSVRTVEDHRSSVKRKMGARNTADVVRLTMQERCPSERRS